MTHEHFLSLKNLYSEYANLGHQVARSIELEDYAELQNFLTLKDKILGHIINQEKIVELDAQEKEECIRIKAEIAALEKDNLAKLSKAKDEIQVELARVNKSANLHKAYTFNLQNSGDIVDSLE